MGRAALLGRLKRLALLVLVPAGALASLGAQAAEAGTVTIVHGVPGLSVDIYVNGALTIEDFQPDTVTDPISLPAGDYDLAVRPADAAAASPPAIGASVTLGSGADASVVAHLDEAASPTLTAFVDDRTPVPAGDGRLVVRHVAATGPLSVESVRVANGDEGALVLPSGNRVLDVSTSDFGAPPVPVVEGTATIVYFAGSPADGTGHQLVQRIEGLMTAPAGVRSGDGSFAQTTGGGTGAGGWALVALGLLLLLLLGIGVCIVWYGAL